MDRDQFLAAALRNPVNEIIAEELLELKLPDAWLVAGCLVQSVWNVLTERAAITASTITTCSISMPTGHGKRKTMSFARWRRVSPHDHRAASEMSRPYRTTPDVNPALRRGGLMSFFRKQCASLPA